MMIQSREFMHRFRDISTSSWTLACILALCPGYAFSADSFVVIDRIEAGSQSDLSASESASLIEIPTGVELSQTEVGTKLQEAKVALEASGKFSDVEFRLGRSNRPQHFVLTTDLKRSSDHYFGVGAEVGYSPYLDDWSCTCSNDEKMKFKKARLNAYTGNRNFLDTGWALDLDLFAADETGSYSNFVQQDKYNYNISQKNEYAMTSLHATAVQQDLLSGHAYAGGIVSVNFARVLSTSIYDFQTDYKGSQIIHADHAHTHNQTGIGAGLVGGVRANDFTLGARWSRTKTTLANGRDNEDAYMLVDGKLQPSTGEYFLYNLDYGSSYRNELVVTLAYSQKPLLNLVEYGLDTFISWQRFYRVGLGDPSNIYAHGEYTWKVSDPVAFTYLVDGIWRRSDMNYIGSSMQRIFQMGGRVDYIRDSGLVLFGQFSRSGVKRNEIAWNDTNDDRSGYVLRSRADLGVQFASPEFLYSFSFIYGAEPISEIIEMNRKQFERLGVH